MKQKTIKNKYEFQVRFRDCDPLQIVWHGNYLAYFEDGREAFGRTHGISYSDVQSYGFAVPLVKAVCEYKLPLKYGEMATVETTFVETAAAKMIFRYKIYNAEKKIVCTGETIQVFLDVDGNLQLNNPKFYEDWKKAVFKDC